MSSSSVAPSPTSSVLPSTTTSASIPTQTGDGGSGENGGGSKQLLFFVALGFGVVFTNLWIIVGVKYCFRYNRRARAGLLDADNVEPIGLGAMPGSRPRRRRDKKLMSMEEVNERFPLTRYKAWKSAREQQGLTPEGGVTAPHSRAASIRSVAITSDAPASRAHEVTETTDVGLPTGAAAASEPAHIATAPIPETTGTENSSSVERREIADPAGQNDDDEEEHDIINDPIHPSNSEFRPEDASAGDTCAICIDALENDDEVRGLTCGHAFHAGCLDPWLTGRRACCPLCKADYYVPKPRDDAEAARDVSRPGILAVPRPVFLGRGAGFLYAAQRPPFGARSRQDADMTNEAVVTDDQAQRQGDSRAARAVHFFRDIPARLPARLGGIRRPGNGSNDAAGQSTPAQLEAGQRT